MTLDITAPSFDMMSVQIPVTMSTPSTMSSTPPMMLMVRM